MSIKKPREQTALPSREDILAFIARERENGHVGKIGKREGWEAPDLSEFV